LKFLFNDAFQKDDVINEDFLFEASVFCLNDKVYKNLNELKFADDFQDLITEINKIEVEVGGRRPEFKIIGDKVDVSKLEGVDNKIKRYLESSCLRLNSPPIQRGGPSLSQPLTSRLYHQDPKHSPKIISGFLNTISRDFYCLVEFVSEICCNTETFPNIPQMRIPFQALDKFYFAGQFTTKDYIDQLRKNGEEWFIEDFPMYIDFHEKFKNLSEKDYNDKYRTYQQLYCLSCLDKAAFFFHFGPTFQKILGYDKAIISDVNPFQTGPDRFNEEIKADKILHEYESVMNEVKGFLDNWKNVIMKRLEPYGDNINLNERFILDGFLSGEDGNPPSVTLQQYLDAKQNDHKSKKKLTDEIKGQFERYIDNVIKPIQEYLKKLDGYTEVLTQKRVLESKVKRLERQILDMRERGVPGGSSSSSTTQDQKKVQSFNEMLARIKISDLLKQKFPMVNFVDKIASQTSRGVCLRFNVEDQIVGFIMTSFHAGVNDIDSFVKTKFDEEISKPPLNDCLMKGTFMTPGLDQTIEQMLEIEGEGGKDKF
jgi:hypothetical protein